MDDMASELGGISVRTSSEETAVVESSPERSSSSLAPVRVVEVSVDSGDVEAAAKAAMDGEALRTACAALGPTRSFGTWRDLAAACEAAERALADAGVDEAVRRCVRGRVGAAAAAAANGFGEALGRELRELWSDRPKAASTRTAIRSAMDLCAWFPGGALEAAVEQEAQEIFGFVRVELQATMRAVCNAGDDERSLLPILRTVQDVFSVGDAAAPTPNGLRVASAAKDSEAARTLFAGAAQKRVEAVCVADVDRRAWTTANVQWMSGKRTSYGVVAWRLSLQQLAADVRRPPEDRADLGARPTPRADDDDGLDDVGRDVFAEVAEQAASRFAAKYVSLVPKRVMCAQWARDVRHCAATALAALAFAARESVDAALSRLVRPRHVDSAEHVTARAITLRRLRDATAVLLHCLAVVAAPAREVAAALNAKTKQTPKEPPTSLTLTLPTFASTFRPLEAHAAAAADAHAHAPTDGAPKTTVPWADVLAADLFTRPQLLALLKRRPELIDDTFPPLTDDQQADAGILRAFLIHRRLSHDGAQTPPCVDVDAEPPKRDVLADLRISLE